MTYEKPWLKEYSRLLAELGKSLGGRVDTHTSPKRTVDGLDVDYTFEAAYYNYCTYHCELDGIKLQVEISHFAMAGDSALVDGDYEEFLVVSAFLTPAGIFRIHPEGFYDRIRKALKLNWEFQTGNAEFDRAFYLNATDDDAQQALMRAEVQETITQLMPFEFLQTHPGGIRCSQLLSDEAQLAADHVIEQIHLIAKLAALVRK